MPTYKEALKKLRAKKVKPKKKVIKRKKPAKKKPAKKVIKRVKPRKKVAKPRRVKKAKPIKKKIVRKESVKKKVTRKAKPKRKIVKRIVRRKIVKKKLIKRKVVKKAKPRKKVRQKPVKKRKIIKKAKPRKVIKRAKPRKKPVKRKKIVKRKPRRKKIIKPRVYIGKGTLDQLFESQAKVKLLRFFFRNVEGLFQPKEIFKRLRSNTTLLRQEMKKMEKIGLLKQKRAWLSFEKKRGGIRKEKRLVYYLNPGFDFFSELRDLILKTAVASKSDLVNKARKTGNIKLLALTGVFTGDDTVRADLLIVGDKINHRKLNNFIKDLEAEVGKELNCAVLTTKEFDYRYDMYDRFVRDLLDGESEILIKRINLW